MNPIIRSTTSVGSRPFLPVTTNVTVDWSSTSDISVDQEVVQRVTERGSKEVRSDRRQASRALVVLGQKSMLLISIEFPHEFQRLGVPQSAHQTPLLHLTGQE